MRRVSVSNTMLISWVEYKLFKSLDFFSDIGMHLQLDGSLLAHPAPMHAIVTEWGHIMQTLVAVLPLAASELYLLHMWSCVQGFDQSERHMQY